MAKEVIDKSAELQLFEDIQSALSTMLEDKDIYTVEIYNAQEQNEGNERPRDYPYVAVDIQTVWERTEASTPLYPIHMLRQNQQKGQCTLTVHCLFSDLKTETERYLVAKPIAHCVYRYLQGLKSDDYYTQLDRQTSFNTIGEGKVFDIQQIFTCEIIESGLLYSDDNEYTVTEIDTDTNLDDRIFRADNTEITADNTEITVDSLRI